MLKYINFVCNRVYTILCQRRAPHWFLISAIKGVRPTKKLLLKKSSNHHCTSFLLRNYIMENRTSLGTDLLSMNISWSYEDLELLENNYDFTISLIFTVVRSITLILGIIVHRAFYKLMKRIPGRAINQIIYPYMVIYL